MRLMKILNQLAYAAVLSTALITNPAQAADPSFSRVETRQVIEEIVHPYSVRTYATQIEIGQTVRESALDLPEATIAGWLKECSQDHMTGQ